MTGVIAWDWNAPVVRFDKAGDRIDERGKKMFPKEKPYRRRLKYPKKSSIWRAKQAAKKKG